MKINDEFIEEKQSGDFDVIEGGIEAANLGLALTMVSKNLYSNAIGSFIRELTTNAYDANIDNDVNNPVDINFYLEDGIYFLTFTDQGKGLNPEDFATIYMNWFSSNKRKDNSKHGGWGLGSKSPFAYQDSFEVITRVDKVEYHYILVNKQPKPEATLLSKEPCFLADTGTTIKIEIDQKDIYTINKEFKNQLCYFDNVYIKDEIYYYNNNFKIYESKNYILRNKDRPFGEDMHIVLGQVPYPIDWLKLDIPRVTIPVALKFDIGDLDVTLSREALDYSKDRVIEGLKERILLVQAELIEKYKEQIVVKDLFKYIEAKNSSVKIPLKIEDVELRLRNNKYPLSLNPYRNVRFYPTSIKDLFNIYNVIRLKKGKHYNLHGKSIFEYHQLYNNPERCKYFSGTTNYFDSAYIDNAFLFKRKKISKSIFTSYAVALGLTFEVKENYNTKVGFKDGSYKIVKEFIDYVDSVVKCKLRSYEGAAPDYWIEEQKENAKVKKERLKGEITFYNAENNRSTAMVQRLHEDHKIVFYMSNKEEVLKKGAYTVLYKTGNLHFRKATKFIFLSQTSINKVSKIKNFHHIDNIFKVKSYTKTFLRIKLTYLFKKHFYYGKSIQLMCTLSDHFAKMYQEMYKLYSNPDYKSHFSYKDKDKTNVHTTIDLYEFFKDEVDLRMKDKFRPYMQAEEHFIPLKKFLIKIDYLHYVNLDSMPNKYLRKLILNLKLLKLNSKYYSK